MAFVFFQLPSDASPELAAPGNTFLRTHAVATNGASGSLALLARIFHTHFVAQASKPAVARVSKPAARPARPTPCRLGSRRHRRLGSLRYKARGARLQRDCEISGLGTGGERGGSRTDGPPHPSPLPPLRAERETESTVRTPRPSAGIAHARRRACARAGRRRAAASF